MLSVSLSGKHLFKDLQGHQARPQACRAPHVRTREFPGGPVVRTLHFHCRGPRFKIPGRDTKIPQVPHPSSSPPCQPLPMTDSHIPLLNPMPTVLNSKSTFFSQLLASSSPKSVAGRTLTSFTWGHHIQKLNHSCICSLREGKLDDTHH